MLNQDKLKEKLLKVLEDNKGNVSAACKSAGISRGVFYVWKNEDKDFRDKVNEIDESVGDFVENKLMTRIDKEDTTAMIFYCKTKLKHRGYTEKPENSEEQLLDSLKQIQEDLSKIQSDAERQ